MNRSSPVPSNARLWPLMSVIVISTLVFSTTVWAETLVTSLSTQRVAITSTYTGADIVVFGVVERDGSSFSRSGSYDLLVTVRGPRRSFIVREKERLGFAWINRSRRHFENIPGFLAVLSNKPLPQLTTLQLRQRMRLGIEAILTPASLTQEAAASEARFRAGLRRIETAAGRFVEDDKGVTFLTPTVFRARIALPATTPTGPYEIEVQLFAGETPLARTTDHFEVIKTGFEQDVALAAREHKLLYGLAAAMMALLFGWFASVIFRRD
jgi:uncharacterized protein (TIGR02186 family)